MQILTIKALTSLIYSLLIASKGEIMHSTNSHSAIHKILPNQTAVIQSMPFSATIDHVQRRSSGYQNRNVPQIAQSADRVRNADNVGGERYHRHRITINIISNLTKEELALVKETLDKTIEKCPRVLGRLPSDVIDECDFIKWNEFKIHGNANVGGQFTSLPNDRNNPKIRRSKIESVLNYSIEKPEHAVGHEFSHLLIKIRLNGGYLPRPLGEGMAELLALYPDLNARIDYIREYFMPCGSLSKHTAHQIMYHTTEYEYSLWPVILNYINQRKPGALDNYLSCFKEALSDAEKQKLCRAKHIESNFDLADFKKTQLKISAPTDKIVLVCDPSHCKVTRSIQNNEGVAVIIVKRNSAMEGDGSMEQFDCMDNRLKNWFINTTNDPIVSSRISDTQYYRGCDPISTHNTILLLCDINQSKCEVFSSKNKDNESVTVFIVKGYNNTIEEIECRDNRFKNWVIDATHHTTIQSDMMANTKYYSGCNIKSTSCNSASSGLTTTAVGVGLWVLGAMAMPIVLPFNRGLLS